jgi:hypothetical protein
VAQLSKKRHTVAASLRETCHEQQTKPRHLSLCSNTPHRLQETLLIRQSPPLFSL